MNIKIVSYLLILQLFLIDYCINAQVTAKRDTVINNISYTHIIHYGPRHPSRANDLLRICVLDKQNRLNGPCLEYHPNTILAAKGNYVIDLAIGNWEYFHPNGLKSKQVIYDTITTIESVHEAGPTRYYKYKHSVASNIKMWDDFGDPIELSTFQIMHDKQRMVKVITEYERDKNHLHYKNDIGYRNRIDDVKKYFKKKYPNEAFWEKPMPDIKVIPDTNTFVIADDISFTLVGLKCEPIIRGDTIYLDLGIWPTNKMVILKAEQFENLSMQLCYETTISVRAGSNHFDLMNYKHGYTSWQKVPIENNYYNFYVLKDMPTTKQADLPFPKVPIVELQNKVKVVAGEDWYNSLGKITSPKVKPCTVNVSATVFKVSAIRKVTGKKTVKYFVLRVPLGC